MFIIAATVRFGMDYSLVVDDLMIATNMYIFYWKKQSLAPKIHIIVCQDCSSKFRKGYPAFFLVALAFKPFVHHIILKYPTQLKSRNRASLLLMVATINKRKIMQ